MRILRWLKWLGVVLFFGFWGLGLVAAWSKVERSRAERDVRTVLAAQVEAWNRGDLDGFMAGYWDSEALTFYSGGTVTQGWQPTLDRYRKRYQADGKEMGTLTFDDLTVLVYQGQPTARGRWKVVTSKETFEGLFTLLFRWHDGRWVIVHDHTSAAESPKNP
jgi:ketosteroid isomerase-like protein